MINNAILGVLSGRRPAIPGGDPYWDYVVALLHFNGGNPGYDSKSTAWGETSVSLNSSEKKFGDSSLQLSGAGSLQKGNSVDFSMFQMAYTWEAWIRPTTSASMVIFDNRLVAGGDSQTFVVFIDSGDLCFFDLVTVRGSGKKVVVNEWSHIAVSRGIGTSVDTDSRLLFYVDGVNVIDTLKSEGTINDPRPFIIGTDIVGGAKFVGQIDDVRITRGAGRYRDEFEPPTAQFPDFGI